MVDDSLPVMQMSFMPRLLMIGMMVRISVLSPEFEMAMTTSPFAIMPRSP